MANGECAVLHRSLRHQSREGNGGRVGEDVNVSVGSRMVKLDLSSQVAIDSLACTQKYFRKRCESRKYTENKAFGILRDNKETEMSQ